MELTFALALSLHLLPGEWNGVHPSVRIDEGPWSLGVVLNSESNVSAVAGYTLRSGAFWAEIGLATGYSAAPVVPWVRAGARWEDYKFFVAPAATTDGDIGVVFGVEFDILRF